MPAQADTLNQALAAAYKNNPEIDAERARLRATDEGVAIANSGFRPDISASVNVGVQNTNTVPDSPTEGRSRPRGYALNLNQTLFQGFQIVNSVNEAEANVRAGQETLRDVEQRVLLQAATAYVDVVRDLAILRLRQANLTFLQRQLQATQDRFQVGEVTRTDVAQARAARAAAASAIDLARANLRASRARYRQAVGQAAKNLREPRLPSRLLPKTVAQAIAVARRQNPAVIRALYLEQAARFTVARITGQLAPSVTLEAQYSKQRDSTAASELNEQGSLTARMNIPLYQGGETYAQIRQAKHQHVGRIQDIETARQQVRSDAVSAWSLFLASQAQLTSAQVQVDANRIALQGVQEEERVGQRTLLDVLEAQQTLLDSEVALSTTRRDIVVNAYTLLSAMGRLDGIQYRVASKLYDPDVHYHEVRRKWFGLSITHRDGRRERYHAKPGKHGTYK
ncbi:MAG: TolC family outer membrane protein [Pseudomonadota bacterium]